MKYELSHSQAALIAGGGLYDHLPAPNQPPSIPSQTSEEKRQILDQFGLGDLHQPPPGQVPFWAS